MADREGIIKFDLDFRPGPPPPADLLRELDAWRQIFRQLGLLGQDPGRYDGLGFGNLSRRAGNPFPRDAFIISGTQTGNREYLVPSDYVIVLACDPKLNHVIAEGPVRPSSEALSHGVLYQSDPAINWVMHLHSPDIFASSDQMKLPTTDPAADYGSPALAAEIERLRSVAGKPSLMVMGGHKDGILAYGASASAVGKLAVQILAEALAQRTLTAHEN